jgi:hypothetical protein
VSFAYTAVEAARRKILVKPGAARTAQQHDIALMRRLIMDEVETCDDTYVVSWILNCSLNKI